MMFVTTFGPELVGDRLSRESGRSDEGEEEEDVGFHDSFNPDSHIRFAAFWFSTARRTFRRSRPFLFVVPIVPSFPWIPKEACEACEEWDERDKRHNWNEWV